MSNSFGPTIALALDMMRKGVAVWYGALDFQSKAKTATEKQGADAMVNTWILATMAKAVKQKGMK